MNTHTTQCIRLAYLEKAGVQYINNPSLAKVLDTLTLMDGEEADTMSITLSNGDSMDVGGGANGLYKCHARTPGSFYELLNPALQKDMSDTVDIQMDNESNTFPRCTIVSLEAAREALERFFASGELSSRLQWGNDLEYEPL